MFIECNANPYGKSIDDCELVKEYRMAFKSNNVWYKRGE